jgi:hypothetical protein
MVDLFYCLYLAVLGDVILPPVCDLKKKSEKVEIG